jgi:transcriptional regulator with XRE-family HTH domain
VNKKTPNPIDLHVGQRVRLRRMQVGLSQEKLGEALGVTFQQIQKYEKGSNRISASRLQGIADLLDVPVAYFFAKTPAAGRDETSSTPPARDVMGLLATSEGVQLASAFAAIEDAEIRRRLVDLAEILARRGGA